MGRKTSGRLRARRRIHRLRALQLLGTVALGGLILSDGASAQTTLPDINVIAPTPLSGRRPAKPSTAPAAPASQTGAPSEPAPVAANADPTAIDRDKVPSNTVVLTPNEFSHEYTPSFLDALNRGLPGVSLSDQTGNPFQKDLNYRGFTASPVQGTPQGIAVYQNGVRVNESWGDAAILILARSVRRSTLGCDRLNQGAL
jgi:iron complex outermembrane receptor protein